MRAVEPYLTPHDQQHLANLLQKIQSDENIIGAIQFGSSLETAEYQDIDICLFSRDAEISMGKMRDYHVFLPEKFEIHFFHRLPLYIQKEVLETGCLLYEGDYDRLFDVCLAFIKEFNLYEPRYREYIGQILDD